MSWNRKTKEPDSTPPNFDSTECSRPFRFRATRNGRNRPLQPPTRHPNQTLPHIEAELSPTPHPPRPVYRHRRRRTPYRPLSRQEPIYFTASAADPAAIAAQILDIARYHARPAHIAGSVAALVARAADAPFTRTLHADGQIRIVAGRWHATVGSGWVSVSDGQRRASAFGDTDALIAASAPVVKGGCYRLAHQALEALPPEATPLTVTLVASIEAVLDAADDGALIPDEALAEAARCSVAAVQQHRDRIRSVFSIRPDRGRAPGRPMYRYRRREWDESRGVAYIPARVLTDPSFTHSDVAVLVGRASWQDYQGRINQGGTRRAVGRRAKAGVATVSRTYAKLRDRGLLVGDRLRVELLRPQTPHARSHLRQDLDAAANRALRRRPPPRPPESQTHTTDTPINSIPDREYQDPDIDLPMRGAQQRAPQKQQTKTPDRPRSDRPNRVWVPEYDDIQALTTGPGWKGPPADQLSTEAHRSGWRPAAAAALEVEWRQHQPSLAVRHPKALARTLALCYADRCRNPHEHTGPCGAVARRLHTTRRADDPDYRRRLAEARRQHQPGPPLRLRTIPADPTPADPRPALLRRIIADIETGLISRDEALSILESAGLGGVLHATLRKPGRLPG